MKTIVLILALISISVNSVSQVAPGKYFIGFTDKNNSAYAVERPSEFLTLRAIERRTRQGIPVEENNLPVNSTYITTVRNLGVTVLTVSRWFNGITIYTPDSSVIQQIMSLPFVSGVVKSGVKTNLVSASVADKFGYEQASIMAIHPRFPNLNTIGSLSDNYGQSYNQIHMVNGDLLHNMGYRGEGMVIAILDGGFFMTDLLPAFDSLRLNNQILGTRDFVVPGNNVYAEHPHGMEVLSIIGGNLPGQLVGTAPKAHFWLLRSEDTNSEFLVEEYNWVSAAEFADSVGADVINSSLGYTTFNDSTMNHTCAEMTGNITPVSQGANIAFSKGMIVVNSAGNSGGSSWKCVGAPADGYMVLAIAAVDSMKNYASFSSTGKVDTRVKPNIAAQGKATVLSAPDGSVSRGSGTSFSSPVIAGMVTCLWQALRSFDNKTIIRAVEICSSQANDPDSLLGYGIPDFSLALTRAGDRQENVEEALVDIFPNPFSDRVSIRLRTKTDRFMFITLTDLMGRIVRVKHLYGGSENGEKVNISSLDQLTPGCYVLKLVSNEFTIVRKVMKNK